MTSFIIPDYEMINLLREEVANKLNDYIQHTIRDVVLIPNPRDIEPRTFMRLYPEKMSFVACFSDGTTRELGHVISLNQKLENLVWSINATKDSILVDVSIILATLEK